MILVSNKLNLNFRIGRSLKNPNNLIVIFFTENITKKPQSANLFLFQVSYYIVNRSREYSLNAVTDLNRSDAPQPVTWKTNKSIKIL